MRASDSAFGHGFAQGPAILKICKNFASIMNLEKYKSIAEERAPEIHIVHHENLNRFEISENFDLQPDSEAIGTYLT